MYGNFDKYFHTKEKGFHNSIWVELIGFEKNAPDYGVAEYLENVGFQPDSVSLHLTSINFANTHKGMDTEYVLPPYACSYNGHPENDLRKRQDWTNHDLRGLIQSLQKNGIHVFASFFDLNSDTDSSFIEAHPEIVADGVPGPEQGIMMIKRFADGTYYEDFLLTKLLEIIKDYGFDGIQLADGISSPRNAIWFADFSEDILEQSGIEIPAGEDARTYIQQNKRSEWIAFYRKRWGEFLKKIIGGLKAAGAEVAVNSAWTRDPLEALYRYGADYRMIEEAGADYFVVEDVSSDLAILGKEDNHNYEFSYEERKLIHFEFLANLMAINAHTGLHTTPLFMIWDNQEQWDVLHHMPTAMQRAAAANFTHFSLRNNTLTPLTGGPHFCLGDALSADDWKFIRLCLDNGYTPEVTDTAGATFIWSAARMENELSEFIAHATCHSARWLALLMRAGAEIGKIADISQLDVVSGDIVVANYDLLPAAEQTAVDSYAKGRVIKVGLPATEDASKALTPNAPGWPRPMDFQPIPAEYVAEIAALINEPVNAKLISGEKECTLHEVFTGENTSRITLENNEYFYVLPMVETKRKIKNIKIITKPDGYPLYHTDNTFRVRVAGRGADIAEIEYEN